MYDTVSAVLQSPPQEVCDPSRWEHERSVVDVVTGEVKRRYTSVVNGLSLTLHGERALQAERSLPKLLNGQNITDLSGPSVAAALAGLDVEIAEALGGYWGLPSVGTWEPVRGDYPRSEDLGSDAAVQRRLDDLRSLEMPYKGLPVVGQSHSLTWSKGAIRLKVYSKFAETKHDDRALGLCRFEVGVFRLATFRKLLGAPAGAAFRADSQDDTDDASTDGPAGAGAAGDGPRVTLLDVLTPTVFELVHEKFRDRLRGDVMAAKEIEGLWFAEMLAELGFRRTSALIGMTVVWGLQGIRSRADILGRGTGSVETRYRVLADYRRVRARLAEKGYTMSPEGTEEADVAVLMSRAFETRSAL